MGASRTHDYIPSRPNFPWFSLKQPADQAHIEQRRSRQLLLRSRIAVALRDAARSKPPHAGVTPKSAMLRASSGTVALKATRQIGAEKPAPLAYLAPICDAVKS